MTSRKSILLCGCAVLALVVFIGCSDDDDPVAPPPTTGATATIGDAGGTLEIPDELVMAVPAGAVDTDIEFKADVNSSPPSAPAGFTLLSPVYEIEPTGTMFDEPVDLMMAYSEASLGGSTEADIVMFTHDGTDWTMLTGVVNTADNEIACEINHLSDFVVAVPVPEEPDPVYAQFSVHREIIPAVGGKADEFVKEDRLFAQFSESSENKPPSPLQAESVSFGEWDLEYASFIYAYTNDTTPEFLTLGNTYDLVVVGNELVPSLEMSVEIMNADPYVTNLIQGQDLDLSGFTLEWAGTDPTQMIDFVLRGSGNSRLDVSVPNNGSYTFTENELSGLGSGEGTVTLNGIGEMPIVDDGYVTSSRIRLTTTNANDVVFTSEAVIEDYLGTSTPGLAIPDKPGGPVTDMINIQAVGAVDSVRVYLDISHQWMSDLIVKLISPDGTELRVLFIGEGGENDGRMQGWYPGDFVPKDDLNGFDGDTAGGNWTIKAQDYSADYSGVLNEWRLHIFYAQ